MSDRINRKNLKHDKFVEGAEDTLVSVRQHARTAIFAAVAILVLIAAAVGWVSWQRAQERKAQTLLADAINSFERRIASEETAANPLEKTWASEEDRLAQTEPMFRAVIDQYGRTDASDIASLYIGQILVRQNKPTEALPLFEAFVREHPEHLLAGAAQMSVYQIRLAGEERTRTIEELERAAASDEPRLPKDAILAMLAEAYESDGNGSKARDAWQRIANEFPDSPYALDAQRRIATS